MDGRSQAFQPQHGKEKIRNNMGRGKAEENKQEGKQRASNNTFNFIVKSPDLTKPNSNRLQQHLRFRTVSAEAVNGVGRGSFTDKPIGDLRQRTAS
ncbi:hypothetical protein Ancab_021975, partial [Ancistrocladus abbreviatus]